MTDKLSFGATVVAKSDYPENVHIRTNTENTAALGVARYAVFDDVKQVSPIFYESTWEQCKAYASGYVKAKFDVDP